MNFMEINETREIFARNLRRIASEKQITQSDIVSATNCSSATVSDWFNGKKYPRPNRMQRIADTLGVCMSDLIEDQFSKSPLPKDALPFNPTHRIPILGRISAGLPLYAEEHIEGWTYTELNGGAEYFALRVHGGSMDALGIKDGYLVDVRRQDMVENGEVAIVMVGDDEATMKRFYQDGDTVTLMPQSTNPAHMPQIYNLKETPIRVMGKVVKAEFQVL